MFRGLERSSSGRGETLPVGAATRIGIGMAEGVEGIGRADLSLEGIAEALVINPDEEPVRPRVPEQCHVDAVVAPAGQLAQLDFGRRTHDLSKTAAGIEIHRRAGSVPIGSFERVGVGKR
jgi:hypothetical protein